jgi:hypothetical protein
VDSGYLDAVLRLNSNNVVNKRATKALLNRQQINRAVINKVLSVQALIALAV